MENILKVPTIKKQPMAVPSDQTKLKRLSSELYVGTKNEIRWFTLQNTHGFTTSPHFGTFVVKHMQRVVADWEDSYDKLRQTQLIQSQGITRFKWVKGILRPFNAAGQMVPLFTVDMTEKATNEAIRTAYDSVMTGQHVKLSSSFGSPELHYGQGTASTAFQSNLLSSVPCESQLDKSTKKINVRPVDRSKFIELKTRLDFKTGPELGNFILDHMEEMSRDWEYVYRMIVRTGHLQALRVRAFRWGDWGVNSPDLKEAFRQAFDLLMGSNVDLLMGSNIDLNGYEFEFDLNLLPPPELSSCGVGETVPPENTNADNPQQGNTEYFVPQSNIQLENTEIGSSEVYDSSSYQSDQNTLGPSQTGMTSFMSNADESQFLSMI